MVTPENLSRVLFDLKAAGVRRAKFAPDGTLQEVEFAEELSEPEDRSTTQVVTVPTATAAAPQQLAINGVVVTKHPGYAALFGANTPRFRSADE
jgi:hypothetical protein